ncbi:MAG: carboxypeptidase M32 [Oscillospiraceae bacterium]
MTLDEAKKSLDELEREMSSYSYAMSVLFYDGQTSAPKGSANGRSSCLGMLTEKSYNLFANEKTGELLAFLFENAKSLDFKTARRVEDLKEEYDKQIKIPVAEFVDFEMLVNDSQAVWERAKNSNDYALFEPYLSKIVAVKKKFAAYCDPSKHPYDYMLNEFEKGNTREYCENYFSEIKKTLVPLIQKVGAARQLDSSCLEGKLCPIHKQAELSDYLMNLLVIDRAHCTLGQTEHPFTVGMDKNDVRISTHYYEHNVASSMYSVIHEGGHALYETGVADEYNGTCLSGGASMACHESQSRFFENMIGRSESFISHVLPRLRELFPCQFDDVSAHELYLAINKAAPSLIRIDADELTYSMHIMVRYEIEKLLFEDKITTKELPETWNRLYREYLGVEVPDDAHGVLQDSHWSGAQFGYFPTYSIGSAYAAQLYEVMKRDIDVEALVADGELAPVCEWLRERIWRFGKLYKPSEMIERACKEPFSPKYYADYLTKKYSEIYGL